MKETPDYHADTRRKGLHYHEERLMLLDVQDEIPLNHSPEGPVILGGELCWNRGLHYPGEEGKGPASILVHTPRGAETCPILPGMPEVSPCSLNEREDMPKDDSILGILHQIGGRALQHTADPVAMAEILDLVEAAIMVRKREKELEGK